MKLSENEKEVLQKYQSLGAQTVRLTNNNDLLEFRKVYYTPRKDVEPTRRETIWFMQTHKNLTWLKRHMDYKIKDLLDADCK